MNQNQAFFKKLIDYVENSPKTIRPIPDYATSDALSIEFNFVLNRCSLLRRYTNTCLPNPVLLTRDAERLQQEIDKLLALEAKRFETFLGRDKPKVLLDIEDLDCVLAFSPAYTNFLISWKDFLQLASKPSFCEHRLLEAAASDELLYIGMLGRFAGCNLIVDVTKQITQSYFFVRPPSQSILNSQPLHLLFSVETTNSELEAPQTEIERLADKYGVKLVSAEENARANGEYRNNMASAGSTIFLNAFDDPELELAAFFHELGHIELERSPYFHQKVTFCKISQEALAWEIGFSLAMAEGYNWEYHSKQKCYARDRLKSYVNYEGDWGGFR